MIVQVGIGVARQPLGRLRLALDQGPRGHDRDPDRASGGHERVVTITRANLVVPVASGDLADLPRHEDRGRSADELHRRLRRRAPAQVQKMLHAGAQALILDLRGNGGGLLDEAVNVASIFIPDGTIVSTAGRSQPRQVYVAKGDAIAPKIPMVVLVDRGTASAAEIVTGALKDRGPREGRRHPHVRQGRLPGDPDAFQRRRARHHRRRVLHAERPQPRRRRRARRRRDPARRPSRPGPRTRTRDRRWRSPSSTVAAEVQ